VEVSGYRQLKGFARGAQFTILVALPVLGILFILDLPTRVGVVLFTEQYIGVFLALYLAGTFLSMPASKRSKGQAVPWYDFILALLALPAGLFITIRYPELAMNLGRITYQQLLFGGLAILLILEALRRLVGPSLVIIMGGIILYARFAVHFPAFLGGRPTSFARLTNYLYLDPNSMLWLLMIAATIGTAFIFFGQVMIHFGVGEILTDLATALVGRVRGGSAKTAVVASSLVGTITGAPMSNVILTGSITIPMMKNGGYPARMAGAVEAVASAGGQIMPPVMGIAAFIIAENLGVPYAEVAVAAIFPAILYYLAVFMQVDLEAGKRGLGALSQEQIPPLWKMVQRSWVALFPVGVLVYTLFIARMAPATAATISALLCVPLLVALPENRKSFLRRLIKSLEGSGRLLLTIGGVMTAAGLVVGAINVSGMGFSISYLLSQLGKGNVMFLLLGAAIASMILGMGMPSVAAYALVAILLAPALVKFGIYPMAAHLFIFYFAIISNFTPPIALTCFAAAPLAGENPMKIGLTSMRLGIMSYIVPFLFVFSPAMLLIGSPIVIFLSVFTAVVGVGFLSVALTGFLFQPISKLRRLVMTVGALGMLIPLRPDTWSLVTVNAVGFGIAILAFLPEIRSVFNKSRSGVSESALGIERET
jgi:TRAP transporter 4TM/12TM fusion protein